MYERKIWKNYMQLIVFYFTLYTPQDRLKDWIEYKFYSFGENMEKKEQIKRSIKWKNKRDGREFYAE
jgi:hypothetical protein